MSLTVIPLSEIKALLGWYRAISTPSVVFLCLKERDIMEIYLVCGKAQSGKNTASGMMKNYLENKNLRVCEIGITRTIKGYAKDYFGWDGNEDSKPRKLLQDLGNTIREKDKYFHINRLCEDIDNLKNHFDVFIVNDIRLPLEIEEIKKRFSCVLAIGIEMENYVSPLNSDEASDITEHALENYDKFDFKIINKNMEDLKQDVINILEGGK